ncbi:FAD/NAD(P)-binding oxidoreductase [Lewinella sp. LCG006]|uniref:NAD(P)/FAD-dependent oxidoreductase n=1 Tax=Lewinella sp. LCG006 TaxID=3231911 RepID=UPI00345FF151
MAHHEVLIVGGGSAGLAVGAMLRNQANPPAVTIVDPSEKHYYQPIWTLVGAGVFPKEISEREEADYIPPGATWIKQAVATFDPDNNAITLANGETHTYQVLVVTAGIQINWDAVDGLKESVGKPGTGVCSNYAFETVESTWANIKSLKKGTAIFTEPNTPIKCGGAPQKITYLACDHWRRSNVRSKIDVQFCKGGVGIFAVKKYADALNKVLERHGIHTNWNKNLVAVDANKKEAVFQDLESGDHTSMSFDMIHVTPPQGPPNFIKNSPLAAETGWVEVDKHTTQHTRYANVFSLGDCSNLPTSKTGAAIRKQAPTTTANIMAFLAGQELPKQYNGYTSCPLVTGYGSLILAEFDYDKQPMESFPFNQAEERYSMYALKAYALPKMYWHGMLRGREF